jgi:hypothetical protein
VGGQLHILVTLPQVKSTRYSLDGPQTQSERYGKENLEDIGVDGVIWLKRKKSGEGSCARDSELSVSILSKLLVQLYDF